jgi:allantoinase
LDLLMKTPNVCFMTGEKIAKWYTTQVPAPSH